MKKENLIVSLLVAPAILVLGVLAFEWQIVDLVTPFVFDPVKLAAWILLCVSTVLSLFATKSL